MELLALIAVVACLIVVVVWYVSNEASGAQGKTGFLAISQDETAETRGTYRDRTRGAYSAKATSPAPVGGVAGRRGRYTSRAEAAYRKRGQAERSGEPPARR